VVAALSSWRLGCSGAPVHLVDTLFGTGPLTITWWQMVLRAIVIFLYLLFLLRAGVRRMSGRFSAYDIVVAVLIGSVLSRALTGSSAFGPTLAAAGVLVVLHWLVARLTFERGVLGWLFKGREELLVRDGVPQRDAMQRTAITDADLLEALRSGAGTDDLSQVRLAYLERSGQISFVRR
jgi:uncharacterized membrane protein YcaP (DUF421 family)